MVVKGAPMSDVYKRTLQYSMIPHSSEGALSSLSLFFCEIPYKTAHFHMVVKGAPMSDVYKRTLQYSMIPHSSEGALSSLSLFFCEIPYKIRLSDFILYKSHKPISNCSY